MSLRAQREEGHQRAKPRPEVGDDVWWDEYVDDMDYPWGDDWIFGYPGVTWRMLNEPFRIVPAWLRDDRLDEYERERVLWAFSDELMCATWGIPESECHAISMLVDVLVRFHTGTPDAPWGTVHVPICSHHR